MEPNFECGAQNGAEPLCRETAAVLCIMAKSDTAMTALGLVINGRYQLEMRRPLFPRKQTWIGPARAGKLGEFQRFSPGGLFGLSFNFLRMNQAHRSGADKRQRFNHPPPVGSSGRT